MKIGLIAVKCAMGEYGPVQIMPANVAMVIGWVGALGSMSAYWAVSTGRVAPDSLRYHGLNICACALLALACVNIGAWPSVVTNLLFMSIGLHMTFKVRHRLLARVRAVIQVAGTAWGYMAEPNHGQSPVR